MKKFNYNKAESRIRDKLCKQVDGLPEVRCKAGIADVVSQDYVIEIKQAKNWKHAIGQVLVYQLEFPGHRAQIHLYGVCSDEFKEMVILCAATLGVLATFENNESSKGH